MGQISTKWDKSGNVTRLVRITHWLDNYSLVFYLEVEVTSEPVVEPARGDVTRGTQL